MIADVYVIVREYVTAAELADRAKLAADKPEPA